ncbi:MAG: hypothetical protein R3B57_03440 [Phycisphaerales bacterium]
MDFFTHLFDTDDFPARWKCGNWTPGHGWLHIISDSLIFVAYFAIPISLAVLLIRRRDFPFPVVLALFSAFILFCGVGHLLEAIIFYHPIYRFDGLWKAGTATVSLITAGVLIKAMPHALSLPSIRKANQELTRALDREQALTAALTAARDDLEAHTAKMTSRSWRLTNAVAAARAVACRWSVPDANIEWEIGFGEGARRAGLSASTAFSNWSDILDEHSLSEVRRTCELGFKSGKQVDIEVPVRDAPGWHILISATPEPHEEGEPNAMIGIFRFFRR